MANLTLLLTLIFQEDGRSLVFELYFKSDCL